jgi:hypothetical protein
MAAQPEQQPHMSRANTLMEDAMSNQQTMTSDGHRNEALRHQIDVRRQVIEKTLTAMKEHGDGKRQALEGKLRDLEAILGEGNWEQLPDHALEELCTWLDEPLP